MKDQQENQWAEYLDEGKQVSRVIKPQETKDIQGALRAKYPLTPIPTHRQNRTFSDKQRKEIAR